MSGGSWSSSWSSEESSDDSDGDGSVTVVVEGDQSSGSLQEVIQAITRLFMTYRRQIVLMITQRDWAGLESFLRRVSSGTILKSEFDCDLIVAIEFITERFRLVVVHEECPQTERRWTRWLVPDPMGQARRRWRRL